MKSPITGKEMILKKEKRTITFRKEEFEVVYHYYLCQDSNEQFTITELDDLNLNQAYNQYRAKFNLPFPEEIIEIRKKYGLSATKMSEVLGFGVNSYRNYESGEVPSQSNARLIQLVKDPSEFSKLMQLSKNLFDDNKYDKFINKINSLIEFEENNFFNSLFLNYLLGEPKPEAITGYIQPSLKKLTEMVVFFTEKMNPWKTKMNKLLFYADFSLFKNSGYAMSGVRYRAINMGPVPNKFNSIFDYMANNDDVDIYITDFQDGHTGEQFKPGSNRKFNQELFNKKELEVLNQVADRFKNTSTSDIIEISHQELAWKENFENGKKLIDYNYSFELKAL